MEIISFILFLLSLVSFIALAVGLIRPQTIRRFLRGELSRKRVGKVFGIAMVTFFILSVFTSPTNTTSTVKTEPSLSAEEQEQLLVEQKESDREIIKKTYEKTIELGKVADGAFGEVKKAMEASDSVQTYFLATDAIQILRGVSNKIEEEQAVFKLNDYSNQEKFKEGMGLIAGAYDSERRGLEKLQKGIDDDSLQSIQEAKESFGLANSKLISGIAKLTEVLLSYDLLDELETTE